MINGPFYTYEIEYISPAEILRFLWYLYVIIGRAACRSRQLAVHLPIMNEWMIDYFLWTNITEKN